MSCHPLSGRRVRDFFRLVSDATDRINIAGLCDPARQNWYPVDLEDTVREAAKLGLTSERVRDGARAVRLLASGDYDRF